MTANVASLTKDASNFQRTTKVSVQLLANTRGLVGYTNTQGTPVGWGNGAMQTPTNSKNFADNEGKWVTPASPIAFNGAWYSSLYITTNGFVVLGADPTKIVDGALPGSSWVTPPSSLPSTSAPKGMAIVAPFWRDLYGGTIRWGDFTDKDGTTYGQTGRFFWVKWENMQCSGTTALQTFAAVFPEGTYWQYVTLLYGSVTPTAGPATVAGCQDQSGTTGNNLAGLFGVAQVTNKYAVLWPNTDNYYFVSHVKIIATKLTSGGSNDQNSFITVQQIANAWPSGMNLELNPNIPAHQTPDTSILTGLGLALDIISLPLDWGPGLLLLFGGLGLDAAASYYSSWAIPPSAIYSPGNTFDTCAYTDNPTKEYHGMTNGIAGLAYDVASYPEFVWTNIETNVASSTHILWLNAEVSMMYPSTYNLDGSPKTWATTTVSLGPLIVRLDPTSMGSDATYTSRTYPDGHYQDFWRMNPASEGVSPPADLNFAYENSAYYRPSGDYNYDMFALTTPSGNSNDQYKVRSDGTIAMEGYYRGYDSFSTGDARDSLLAYLLPMRPEYGNDYAKMVRGTPLEYTILGSSETEWAWHFKRNTLSVGTSFTGLPIKVGVGRHVYGPTNYGETAEWAGTKILGRNTDGSDTFGLSISTSYNGVAGSGGTTKDATPGSPKYTPTSTYSWPCAYYTSSNYVTAQVEAVPSSNSIMLDHWELHWPTYTETKYGNPVQVPMTHDCWLVAVFKDKPNPVLTVRAVDKNGDSTDTAGIDLYTWDGTTHHCLGLSLRDASFTMAPYDRIEAWTNGGSWFRFDHWTLDGVTVSPSTWPYEIDFDMNYESHELLAHYVKLYELDIHNWVSGWSFDVQPEHGATTPAKGLHYCDTGSTVTLTALPVAPSTFAGWHIWSYPTVDRWEYGLTTDVLMDRIYTIDAYFIPIVDANIIVWPSGSAGTTTPTPGLHTNVCLMGGTMTVTAQASAGYTFDHWIGPAGAYYGSNPATIVMTDPEVNYIQAYFVDLTPPVATMVVNNDATYTNSVGVTNTMTANDLASGVSQMRFSNDGTAWSAWEPFSTTKSWNLLSGDGTKTVHCQVNDVAGNAREIDDTIIMDSTAPSFQVLLNGGSTYSNSQTVSVSIAISDTGSPLTEMRFSNDGSSWSAWQPFTTSVSGWTLSAGDGSKTVWCQIKDAAGNIGQSPDGITLDTTPPVTTASAAGSIVTLSASDGAPPASQVMTTKYMIDSGPDFVTYTGPFDVGSGSHTVFYYSVDNAGNQEAVKSKQVGGSTYQLTISVGYYGAKGAWTALTGSCWVDGIQGTTGVSVSVTAGTHTVKVPDQIVSGRKTYYFQKWEAPGPATNPGSYTVTGTVTLRAVFSTTQPTPTGYAVTVLAKYWDGSQWKTLTTAWVKIDNNQVGKTGGTYYVTTTGDHTLEVQSSNLKIGGKNCLFWKYDSGGPSSNPGTVNVPSSGITVTALYYLQGTTPPA